jgi:hypothetical protein
MNTTINWQEYESHNHVLAWVLCEAMARDGIERFGEFDSAALSVELKVNGVPVDFVWAMDFLNDQVAEMRKSEREAGEKAALPALMERLNDSLANVKDLPRPCGERTDK